LEAAGVRIDLSPKGVERCLEEVGIGFLFAPLLHGAMKYATPPRREIGIRTVFNILGPLTNPAYANSHLLGVYDEALTEPLANVLKNLGAERAFLVHGMDGLDEITLTTQTKVSELVDGEVRTYYIKPEDFGLSPCSLDDLKGGDTQENLRIFLDVLNGMDGPRQDVVLMNAGAGIVAGGGARDIMEGIEVAREVIESGKALQKFESLKEYTNTEHHG
jgi:anthranilate phosphoribosyltransferase